MEAMRPDVRVINLETAMTTHDKPWPDKGINYRCHPGGRRQLCGPAKWVIMRTVCAHESELAADDTSDAP
jgi:hypothetical protein